MLVSPSTIRFTAQGYTVLLGGTRVALTTAQRFGTGEYDLELLDSRTGLSVSCRGFNKVVIGESRDAIGATLTADATTGWYDHGHSKSYTVLFGKFNDSPGGYLSTMGGLDDGEVVLNALPPKSLPRRVSRFMRRGAIQLEHGILALSASRPTAWPPELRERKVRPRSGEGAWNKANPDRPRYF